MRQNNKTVLMVAFHFPPFTGSSGVQRTLRFVQHLPRYGWQAVVLSVNPRAYESTSEDLIASIPEGTHVQRTFAFDAARHFSVANRYPGFLARPDRWMSWKWSAVGAGLRLIDRFKPGAIWSTYPIATAHLIGSELQKRSRLPWVADFRDPMVFDDYPPDPATWRSFKAIEQDALHRARFSVLCTPGARRRYAHAYPDVPQQRLAVIENGFDEESFAGVMEASVRAGPLLGGRIVLLHSGIVYGSERDPTRLIEALARIKATDPDRARRLTVRFRASSNDALLRSLSDKEGVSEMVELLPPIPYRQALEEIVRADGLLVLQAANSNEQIPAKLYEYFRSGRPILGLTDAKGDTASAIRAAGINDIAPLDDVEAIHAALARWVNEIESGTAARPSDKTALSSTRAARAGELALLLERVA